MSFSVMLKSSNSIATIIVDVKLPFEERKRKAQEIQKIAENLIPHIEQFFDRIYLN